MKMVVKDKIGRRRYIVFKILEGDDITRRDLIYTFNRSLPETRNEIGQSQCNQNAIVQKSSKTAKVLTSGKQREDEPLALKHRLKDYDGSFGILFCPHWMQKDAILTLNSLRQVGNLDKPVKIESLGTSGTLKKARKKYIH